MPPEQMRYLLTFIIVGVALVLIFVFLIRWVLRIDTIVKELKGINKASDEMRIFLKSIDENIYAEKNKKDKIE